jgi:formate-dependent nitrite reductase membrane component NrfD
VSEAEVTRSGPRGERSGEQARMWSGGSGAGARRKRRDAPPRDHPGDSYYGRPIINPPVWEELDIAGYLFLGGLAGGSSIVAAGADLSSRPVLAVASRACSTGAIGLSLIALVHDLGRPARFLNMLRVFKPTSPMSVGVWILVAYAPLSAAATGSSVLGIAPRLGRLCGLMAAGLGAAVASYTAALIADTAVPAWHEGHRELPFLFVASAAAASAGFGLVAAPVAENAPVARLAVAGAVGELVAERLLERRLGPVAETLETGTAGRRLRAAKALTLAGGLVAAAGARRSRAAAIAAGGALLAGSALTRFGVFAAGMASAEDPRYTVQLQRARRAAREAAGAR